MNDVLLLKILAKRPTLTLEEARRLARRWKPPSVKERKRRPVAAR